MTIDHEIETAWRACSDLFIAATTVNENYADLHEELVFCLLGGHGISYELARSATKRLMTLDPFGEDWSQASLERVLYRELLKPQFEPVRKDGRPRKYRFPRKKAITLARARDWLLIQGDLARQLLGLETDGLRRDHLCECPGIGPKTASWFLRNTGLATNLAIIDIHVMRALRATGRVVAEELPRSYKDAETAFLTWCSELDAPAPAFDLFLWEWMRGSIRDSS